MDLSRAADLLEVDICQARAPAMGAEPEVRIPVSMARVYLEAARTAAERIKELEAQVSPMNIRVAR